MRRSTRGRYFVLTHHWTTRLCASSKSMHDTFCKNNKDYILTCLREVIYDGKVDVNLAEVHSAKPFSDASGNYVAIAVDGKVTVYIKHAEGKYDDAAIYPPIHQQGRSNARPTGRPGI